MWKSIKSIAVILLGTACVFTAHGLFTTILPLYLESKGSTPEIAGLLMSAYYGGYIFGSIQSYHIISRVGHIRTYTALASLFVACIILIPHTAFPVLWLIIRFCSGIVMSGLIVTLESWLNYYSPNEQRGRMFSLYMMVLYLSIGCGQFILCLFETTSSSPFALLAIILCSSIILLSLSRSEQPAPEKPSLIGLRQLYSISPTGLMGSVCAGFSLGTFYGLAPTFAREMGYTTPQIGQFMGIIVLSGLAAQWPLGKLSDIFNKRVIILCTAFLLIIASLTIALTATFNTFPPLLSLFLFGASITTLSPLSKSHANTFLNQQQRVGGTSTLSLTFGMGAIIGPFLGSIGTSLFGPSFLFLFIMNAASLFVLYTLYRMLYKRPRFLEDRPSPLSDQQETQRFHPLPSIPLSEVIRPSSAQDANSAAKKHP